MTKKIDLEKIQDYNYFLILTSFVFFTDTYMIYFYNLSVRDLDLNFLKQHIGDIFVMLFVYSFTMAVASKIVNIFINMVHTYYSDKHVEEFKSKNYILLHEVLDLAIENNNSVLYNYYIQKVKDEESIRTTQYLSTAVIIMFICNYFVSSDAHISLMKIYELFINNNKWYMDILNLIPIATVVFIAYSILDIRGWYYIYLDAKLQKKLFKSDEELVPENKF